MLLEEVAKSSPILTYVMLGILVLIVVLGPFLMRSKNKKEQEKMEKMIDTLKKGDKVLTTAGVFGKVIAIEEKENLRLVTIETGNEGNKGYLTFDVGAIYCNLTAQEEELKAREEALKASQQPTIQPEVVKVEETTEQPVEEKVEEPKKEVKVSKPKTAKKTNKTAE